MLPRCFVLMAGALALTFAPLACGGDPWNVPFAGDPAQVLAAARAIHGPADSDTVVLLDEQRYTIDAGGRLSATKHIVYRVVTADGAEEEASVAQEYAPWHESKPTIRARVITADGTAHWLDAKTITDAPAEEFGSNLFSDRRILQAPLPAVAPDSVVEYEVTVRETAPLSEAGTVRRIDVWNGQYIQRLHLTLDAAPGVPLRTASQLIPAEAMRREETKAGVRVECEWGPIQPVKEREFHLPFDVAGHPVFEFATGRSWREVAARYSSIVDGRIARADLGGLAEAPKTGETTQATAARLTSALHRRVRYTGLELGDSAIVPAAPAEVLSRRYGDCKDKAALLVAMLRSAGLKAHVALLSAGFGLDVTPSLPGFGGFDHAIVYVEASPPLWIDATAQFTRVGDLPAADQGRLALIADAASTELVKTPESTSADNRVIHKVDIRLAPSGPSEIQDSVEGYGSEEADLRARYDGAEPAKVKESLEQQAKLVYLAKSVGDSSSARSDDFSRPFTVSVTAKNASRAVTENDEAVAALFGSAVFNGLPGGVISSSDDEREPSKPRTDDFVLRVPFQSDYHYRVYYPNFLKPRELPKDQKVAMGPATFTASYRQDSGYVEADYRFDSGKRRFTPAEYAELRAGLERLWSDKPEMLSFASLTSEAIALGKIGEAVRLARGYATQEPESATAQARLSRVLTAAGAGISARNAARRATELDPHSEQAWEAMGQAYEHDSFGRLRAGDWNSAEAEKAYRKAIEFAADKTFAQNELAILLEFNSKGDRYAADARLDEAVAMYRAIRKGHRNDTIQRNLVILLMRAGKYEEARSEVKSLDPSTHKAALAVIVASLTDGPGRAILDAQKDEPDPNTRHTILLSAAVTLVQMRRYEPAVELLKAAQRISSSPELEMRLAMASRVHRFEERLYPSDDPRSVVQRLFQVFLGAKIDEAQVRALMSRHVTMVHGDLDDQKVLRGLAGLRGRFNSLGLSGDGIADFLLSIMNLEKEGDDGFVYRVRGKQGGDSVPFPPVYVVKEDGQYRIIGMDGSPEDIGRLVLGLVKSGDLETARRWLDLVITGVFRGAGEPIPSKAENALGSGPAGDDRPAAHVLWSSFPAAQRTAAAIRITAASLIGEFSPSEEAIGILKQARQTAPSYDIGNIDLALCQAYLKAEKWTELAEAAKRLTGHVGTADYSFFYLSKARIGLKQWDQLEADVEAALKSKSLHKAVLKEAVAAMLRAGKPDRAAHYMDLMEKPAQDEHEQRVMKAWIALLGSKPDENLIADLQRDRNSFGIEPDSHYVAGLLQCQAGKADEARQSLRQALDLDDPVLADARPWVLQGKIQEQFGNSEEAAAAYAEARKRPAGGDDAVWALKLITSAAKP